MPDTTKYYGWDSGLIHDWLDLNDYSPQADFIMGHDGTAIVLVQRDGTVLASQTVRLVNVGRTGQARGMIDPATSGEEITVLLIGRRDHPTETDFNVTRGDEFAHLTIGYEVTYVDKTFPGYTIAQCRAVQ
jgi:hypothetical protein